MQSQQRAENGVREVVIGYANGEETEDSLEDIDFEAVGEIGQASEVQVAQLPEDVRDIYEAEMHRLRTGELYSLEAWNARKRGGET